MSSQNHPNETTRLLQNEFDHGSVPINQSSAALPTNTSSKSSLRCKLRAVVIISFVTLLIVLLYLYYCILPHQLQKKANESLVDVQFIRINSIQNEGVDIHVEVMPSSSTPESPIQVSLQECIWTVVAFRNTTTDFTEATNSLKKNNTRSRLVIPPKIPEELTSKYIFLNFLGLNLKTWETNQEETLYRNKNVLLNIPIPEITFAAGILSLKLCLIKDTLGPKKLIQFDTILKEFDINFGIALMKELILKNNEKKNEDFYMQPILFRIQSFTYFNLKNFGNWLIPMWSFMKLDFNDSFDSVVNVTEQKIEFNPFKSPLYKAYLSGSVAIGKPISFPVLNNFTLNFDIAYRNTKIFKVELSNLNGELGVIYGSILGESIDESGGKAKINECIFEYTTKGKVVVNIENAHANYVNESEKIWYLDQFLGSINDNILVEAEIDDSTSIRMTSVLVDNLRQYLIDLNDSLTNQTIDSKSLAIDIKSTTELIPLEKSDYVISLLFPKQTGILSFILKSKGLKHQEPAKKILLSFLADLIGENKLNLTNYYVEIKNCCVGIFKHPKEGSATKLASFEPLISIAAISNKTVTQGMDQLFTLYLNEYFAVKTGKLKSSIFILLGTIAKNFPKQIHDLSKEREIFLRYLISSIKSFQDAKDLDLNFISGAIRGLDLWLCSFPELSKENTSHVYQTVIHVINLPEDLNRYDLPKAVLDFLTNHSHLFNKFYFSNRSYEIFYRCLKSISSHKNRELVKSALRAQFSFLKQISILLSSNEEDESEKSIFSYFLFDFIALLKSDQAPYEELSAAIRGIGYFSKALKKYYPISEIKNIFTALVNKSSSGGIQDRTQYYTSAYLDSFACLVEVMSADELDDGFMSVIEQMMSNMLIHFPKFYITAKFSNAVAMRQLLFVLFKKGSIFTKIWTNIVYEALILTCSDSYQTALEVAAGEDESETIEILEHAYKDYFVLWETLFKINPNENSSEDAEEFLTATYDLFIFAIFQLIKNLDLTTTEAMNGLEEKEEDDTEKNTKVWKAFPLSGNVSNLSAKNPKDFLILLNLVEFAVIFLKKLNSKTNFLEEKKSFFYKWIRNFGAFCIEMSSSFPVVSAFYKLMSLCLELADGLGFFRDILNVEAALHSREGFETEIVSTATESQKISYSIFVNYLKEVRIRMHYYRDDLLASCLQLLLNAPQELIFVGDLVVSLQQALKFGLSYTPLAFIALNALEKWPSVFKSGKERKTIKLGEIYGQVLPFLKAYLDVDTHSSFESEDSGGIAKSNAVMRFQSKKVKANDPFINQSETLKLRELQFRILSVLGGVGSEHAACVMNEVPNDHESKVKESKLISWDPVKHLSYNIPFKDANIKIFFDDLLPRIVELSENSPERKSKVAACELLHALTVFMIGKSAHRTKENESSQSPFHKLYIHIFPALFRLAADVDNVTRDLFRPLIFQLIHWLTRNSKYENPETMAMLDACLEAVVSNNGTVRDFAADSACEFLKWSIKQTSIQTQRNNPINAKSLFKRLYLLANHGNSNKRYGSALVFNRIYRVFREEASLVEIFSFEILYNLLTSLKISSNDHSVMGTQQQTQTAIRHWKKIIVNKASLFKAVNEKRRLFPGIPTADLSHLIEYLFIESGTPIGVYARECLSLFIEMVRHVADPAQWVRDMLKTPALLPGIFEKSKLNIGKSNTLENQDTKASLFQLIAAFDGYNTLLELNIVPAESLFKNKSSEFLFSVFSMLNLVNNFKVSNLLLSSQSKSLKELIASLVTKCLSFITIILKSSTTNSFQNLEYISTILHSPQFFSIVCKTIFHPGQIGFVVEDDEVKRHLPLITGNFLKNFLKLSKHPDCQVKKIYDDFINYLSLNFKEVYSNVESPHELSNSKNLLQIYNGVKLLQSVGGEDFVGLLGMHDALISCLSLLDKYRYNSTDPNNQSLIAVMTDICLSNKVIRICYLDQFLGIGDDSDVAFELSSLNYQKFSVYINPHLALHWNEFTAIFKKDAKKKILVEILQGLLDYLIRNKSVAKMEAIKFMGDFTAGVEFLSLFLDSRIETSKGNESLLNIWKSLAKLDPNILTHSNNEDFIKLFTETFFKFLDRLLPLQFKVSALDLLPSVLRKTCVDFQVKLNKYLKILIVDTFPISPSDLKIGTSRYNDYSITMEKLLNIIQLTGSTDVIEIVLEHTLREADHIYSVELSNRISIAVDTLSATEMSKPMVRRIIDLGFNFLKKTNLKNDYLKNAADQCLIPTLSSCDVSMLSDVTVDEINYIVGKIVELPARKVEELVDQLVIKTICFEVMEIVYSRLSIQEVHSKNGRIVTSYNSNDEKNDSTLTKILMRAAHDAKREMVPVGESEQLGKIRLAYHQAAYAALAAVVSKTQTEEKFFTVFLFSESISKGTYLWDNIIDKNKKIFFEDLTKPLVQTSLDDFRRKSKTSLTSTTYGQNLKYLSSQYLQDSSLSQTVGFLSNRSLSQNTDVNFQAATISAGMEIGSNSKGERKPQESSRILEIDEINSNICMKGIISCIEKLHTTVSPPINKIPKWIAPLQEKFNKDDTHLNIKIFIARIICNIPEAFSAVASDWWRSLIKLISEASNFGSGINHFVQDICFLLIVWSENQLLSPTSSDRFLIKGMMSYLVANSVHKSKYAINNNQKIIRSFIELWKEFIVPPTESIYGFISSNDIFENRLYTQTKITGLYLCSIFAMNEISPFHEASCSVSAVQFYSALIATLDLKKTEIVSLSSTVIGQLLSLCEINRDMISMNILLNLTHAKLKKFQVLNSDNSSKENFVTVINKISIHFSSIVKAYAKDILYILPTLSNASKALCLEAMTSAAKDIPDLIAELRAKDLIGLLTHRDDACQTYTLNLLTQLTESMTLSDIEFFLDQILSTFYVHPSEPCRRAFYSLIIKLFKIPNVLSSSVTQLLKRATLIGLADSDEQIRNGILSFLHKDLLRPNVFDRAKQLMSDFYVPEVENSFLNYCSVMIFEDSKEAPSYTSSLFDESLPNAHFDRPLRINVSYIQNSAMQPMFASTQTEDMNEKIGDENLVLRATQNDQWTPTVPLTSTQTRNMFSFSQSDTAILSVPKITSHDNSGNAQKPRISVYELKHRTYNKEAPSYLYYAKRAETRRRNKAKTENLKMEAQAKKVSLTRVYRSGELPDIQILNKEIISPLQVLARVDVEVSRQVYYLILQSLLKEKAESQEFENDIKNSIQNIFQTTNLFPPLINALLLVNNRILKEQDFRQICQRRFPNGCRESILEKVNFEPALKKPRTSATKKGLYSEIWSKIAMLYKKMENSEVYHAIYESKIACAQQTKEAIRFESVGNYEKALETFIEALRSENREETQMDLDLWTTGQLECLRKLGKWDELSAISIDEVDGNLSKLWDEDIVDPYLAYFIQSHVRLKNGRIEEQIFYPWTEEEPNPLHTFIDKYLSPNENEKRSKKMPSSEFTKGKIGNYLHALILIKIHELDEFLTAKSALSGVKSLLDVWNIRYPNVEKDSLEVWDDIIFNRKTMLETVPEMAFNFESYEKKFCRKIAKAAREQISLSVAGNWLEKYKPSNNDLYPDYHYPLLKNFLKRLHHSSNLSESINNAGDVLGTFNYYKSSIEKLSEPVQRKFLLLEGCLHSKISEILLDETNKNDILAHIQKNRYFVKDTKNLSSEFCSLGDYQLSFINRAFTSFDFITKNVAESTEYKILEKTFFSFNQFCDKILRKMENYHYDISGNLDKELFATTVVTTNLNLMSKFRNSESVNFFPRLLQIVEIYPATIAPFIKMAESVPLWLFLKWVAQLTAMLDKKSSNGVFPILLKIAKRYPAALIFPLYISSNQYVYQNDQESWKIQDSVKILKELVKSDLLFKLLSELKRLGEPAHIFKDWLDTLPLLLMGQAKAKISESFDEMKTYCLHAHHECMGSVGKSFSQKHGSKILSICGLNGENISKKNYNELIKYYAEKISVEKLNSGTILLKEYSPWLDSFKSANFDELLEVPGQYEGIEKPNILHHTKIFSFHPTVLRKPKKITLIGTDEKEYSWLIKGGEDLRLDQRIQQMFQIMNNILSHNHYCSKNQISLKTYKVVPLTGNLGMIEWCVNTRPYRDCLKSEIGFEKATEAARSLFLENLTKNHKKGGFGEIYASFNTKEKKESVVASFKKVLSVMSEPFLKRYFLKKSSSPEAFLKIRSEFASSLGSLSICSYLLGIGDRHTENFLLDELSGKIIAIDFGHAFGSATEVLPIPEMIPFRLTNQMELFLKPLGKSVLLRQPMISSLQALREKKDLVLNVMDIFIKEPLIEWRDRAMKSAKKQKSAKTASMEGKEVANANEDNGSIAPTWYPIKKLEIASRKLKGENPAVIMIEELSLGHNQKPYFAPLSEAIRGDKQVNFRAQASCTNLAIPDQVDCLIDLATDANILGRTWLGWNPWV
ncbi:hypothetical protein HDU92_001207 [Lobulomyces angularis]|nr:hypothetical protein HDU92_001207 [Lobulomyces angularis]